MMSDRNLEEIEIPETPLNTISETLTGASDTEEKNDSESDESSDKGEDPLGWLPESLEYDQCSAGARCIVYKIDPEQIRLATNRWHRATCRGTCGNNTQHAHILFNPYCHPKETVRSFTLNLCQKKDCPDKENTHTHYPGYGERDITLRIPASVLARLEKLKSPDDSQSLSTMVADTTVIEETIDHRGNKQYIADYFRCHNDNCSLFMKQHKHLFNVDPYYPEYNIIGVQAVDIINQGYTYCDVDCEWIEHLHIHFLTKNE